MSILKRHRTILVFLLGIFLSEAIFPQEAREHKIVHRVVDAISSLPEKHGLSLGDAAVVGDMNKVAMRYGLHRTGPQSRDYSLKMVWAADRNRAIYLGANHATPHRLNDVWEFDLAAMSWILLYGPDNSRSYRGLGDDPSDVVYRDGLLVTLRGGPVVIGHTWSGVSYDPKGSKIFFMNIWLTKKRDAVLQLGGDPENLYAGPPLWTFSPEGAKWSVVKSESPSPPSPFGAMLEYVPSLGGMIWHMNNWQMRGTWLFDVKRQKWERLRVNVERNDFEREAPGRELVGYYDSSRDIVVAQQGFDTFHFDVSMSIWKRVVTGGDSGPSKVPFGHDARTSFYYDPTSHEGILLDHVGRVLWIYNPDTRSWRQIAPIGDQIPKGRRMLAYFDQALNVFVVIDDLSVWVYRHKARGSN